MTRDPSLGMEVAGHTDSFGGSEFNQQLSEARAQSAADWLIENGIDAARIRVVGLGETQPIASNETSAGRASNRRVEFVFGPLAQIVGG
jgi:OOP family OmpA-OmpF porin